MVNLMRVMTCLMLLLPTLALADSVEVSVTRTALKGQGQPAVNVHIVESIAGFRVQLKRSDGKTFDIKGGGKPGTTRQLFLEQPEGHFSWEGTLTINLPNGTSNAMSLNFDTEMYGPLTMSFDKNKDIDFTKRTLSFKLSRPAGKAKLRVLMDTGKTAVDDEILFSKEAAGTALTVGWPEIAGQVMKVELTAYDDAGFYTGLELTPWRVDIPHEEVTFASGKSEIAASEDSKLIKSLELINDAIGKYGRLATITLFIAGHTDTVGPAESNRSLSLARARSLAQYFRKKGLRIPIRYEGFGENAAAVETPDETDEVRNRRAQYIISIDAPTMTNAPFEPKWQAI